MIKPSTHHIRTARAGLLPPPKAPPVSPSAEAAKAPQLGTAAPKATGTSPWVSPQGKPKGPALPSNPAPANTTESVSFRNKRGKIEGRWHRAHPPHQHPLLQPGRDHRSRWTSGDIKDTNHTRDPGIPFSGATQRRQQNKTFPESMRPSPRPHLKRLHGSGAGGPLVFSSSRSEETGKSAIPSQPSQPL